MIKKSLLLLSLSLLSIYSISTNLFNISFTKIIFAREDDNEVEVETEEGGKNEYYKSKESESENDEAESSDKITSTPNVSSVQKITPVVSKTPTVAKSQTNNSLQENNVSNQNQIQPKILLINPTTQSTQKLEINNPIKDINQIEVSDNETVETFIRNQPEFKDIVDTIELEEVARNNFIGRLITKQKLLGLFEVELPYSVELDLNSQKVSKKYLNFWGSILDFLSY